MGDPDDKYMSTRERDRKRKKKARKDAYNNANKKCEENMGCGIKTVGFYAIIAAVIRLATVGACNSQPPEEYPTEPPIVQSDFLEIISDSDLNLKFDDTGEVQNTSRKELVQVINSYSVLDEKLEKYFKLSFNEDKGKLNEEQINELRELRSYLNKNLNELKSYNVDLVKALIADGHGIEMENVQITVEDGEDNGIELDKIVIVEILGTDLKVSMSKIKTDNLKYEGEFLKTAHGFFKIPYEVVKLLVNYSVEYSDLSMLLNDYETIKEIATSNNLVVEDGYVRYQDTKTGKTYILDPNTDERIYYHEFNSEPEK